MGLFHEAIQENYWAIIQTNSGTTEPPRAEWVWEWLKYKTCIIHYSYQEKVPIWLKDYFCTDPQACTWVSEYIWEWGGGKRKGGGDDNGAVILQFGNESHIDNDVVNLDNTKVTPLKTPKYEKWKQNIARAYSEKLTLSTYFFFFK